MTIVESIIRGVRSLPLRQQVEVARYVHKLNSATESARASSLDSTFGVLDEEDGEAFEQALADARRVEDHG